MGSSKEIYNNRIERVNDCLYFLMFLLVTLVTKMAQVHIFKLYFMTIFLDFILFIITMAHISLHPEKKVHHHRRSKLLGQISVVNVLIAIDHFFPVI